MNVVATPESCALQIKLFKESICRVSKRQDLHTRTRQDYAYDHFLREAKNLSVWDPAPYIYGTDESIDVIDDDGNYIMEDWNHISRLQSERLAEPFRTHLLNIAVRKR
jgi:hypothetical protein